MSNRDPIFLSVAELVVADELDALADEHGLDPDDQPDLMPVRVVSASESVDRIQALPVEVIVAGGMALAQSRSRATFEMLTPKMKKFLQYRAICSTDAAARHLMGRSRGEGEEFYMEPCECGEHVQNWIDMRPATVQEWKHQDSFGDAYRMLVEEPLLFAGVALSQLAPKAVMVYSDLLESDVSATVRRSAAKDVIEATGLKATPGVQGSGEGVKTSFQEKMALGRVQRGISISSEQRRLLLEAGHDVSSIGASGGLERSLDGDDFSEDTRGEEPGEDLLPD